METMRVPLVEYGVAKFVLPGQVESGDHHLICSNRDGILIAAIDGIGHGEEAANAAKAATSVLKTYVDEPIISLVERCHDELRLTRGVVLSLAFIDASRGMMTWLGVGNVQGVLMRAGARKGTMQELLLLRAGVIGSQLPPLQAAVLPVARGDTLIFVTDGVRDEFVEGLLGLENPQRAADRILELYQSGNDDALVLVARLTGIRL
jgi:negative regulator of sigma-B (phosphoserine phosphatase)